MAAVEVACCCDSTSTSWVGAKPGTESLWGFLAVYEADGEDTIMDCLGVIPGVAMFVESVEAVPSPFVSTGRPLRRPLRVPLPFLIPESERGFIRGSHRLLLLSELRTLPSVPAVLALLPLAAEEERGGTDVTRPPSANWTASAGRTLGL